MSGADRLEKAVKIADKTCMRHKWQGEERSARHDIEIDCSRGVPVLEDALTAIL
jgi:hypothetical protein